MTTQDLLIYSLLTGCGLFLLINPSVGMAKERRTPERLKTVRICGFFTAVIGGVMMLLYFI